MTVEKFDIQKTVSPGGGAYRAQFADGSEAELTWSEVDGDTISIDHTFVPPQHRGKDFALRLLKQGVEYAARDGKKIIPKCSYSAMVFQRHPEWTHLLAR